MADANTGTSGLIRMTVWETDLNPATNQSRVNYSFELHERVSAGSSFQLSAKAAAVDWLGIVNIWSGSYTFDWRPAGLQGQVIAGGSFLVTHNPDGTSPSVTLRGSIAASGTTAAGGPSSVDQAITLTTLKVIPGVPTGVTATRISDTQVDLAWTQTNASNGAPTSTQIEQSINGGAWTPLVTIGGATAASVADVANRKTQYRVRSGNAAGYSAYGTSNVVYTTPADPTDAVAVKDVSLNIDVSWTPHVGYVEHVHEVWHGTVLAGVTTWDGAALADVAAGTSTYEHVAPNPAQQHVYRIRAKAGALLSGYALSNVVQLLAAPLKPTIPALAPFADKASTFRFPWVHNPVDSTAQTKYQYRYSVDGGATWLVTSAKTASTDQFNDFAGGTWAANTVVTFQVRTKGSYDSGADGDASYSPWSDSVAVTFKTVPVATIPVPATGSTLTTSTISVNVGFAQAEGATFVKTQLELKEGATLLEELESVIQVGNVFAYAAQDGVTYTVRARVQDSNGLWSAWATSTFDIDYLLPVPPVPTLEFIEENGFGQISLSIPAPGVGQAAATTVSITRTIDGVTEVIVTDYPVSATLVFLDTTPVTHGTNTYTITTKSALGAQSTVVADLVTEECRRAYLSKGAAFDNVVVFGANLAVSEGLSVASDTIQAAGRLKPIGLYGMETLVQLKVSSFVFENFGSTIPELRALLLVPGKACYRDASGRRVFGSVKGGVAYKKATRGDLSFSMTETS